MKAWVGMKNVAAAPLVVGGLDVPLLHRLDVHGAQVVGVGAVEQDCQVHAEGAAQGGKVGDGDLPAAALEVAHGRTGPSQTLGELLLLELASHALGGHVPGDDVAE